MKSTASFATLRLSCFLAAALVGACSPAGAEDWPEFQGAGRRNVWNETGIVEKFAAARLPRVWSAPVGPGYSGPTVAEGRVYLMDRGSGAPGEEVERILCFDQKTGRPQWTHSYPCQYENVEYVSGPRACVTIRDGKAYALGTMGHLHCLDAATGEVLWKKDLSRDYRIDIPIWGMTNSPLVEGNLVILQAAAGPEGACVVAFEKDGGKEAWRAFDDKASYVSPMMIEQAGRRILVVWTAFRVAGMNAATGEVFWEIPFRPNKMPINVPQPALDEEGARMFLSTFYDGSRLIGLGRDTPTAELLWSRQGTSERNTDALHCMISSPYLEGGHVYGVDSYGQLRCLDATTGDRVWEDLTATPPGRWSTIFMVRNGDRTWMLNEQGDLIIARFNPRGFQEISRAWLIDPATELRQRESGYVLWSPPAYAHKHIFARNGRELICVDLSASP